MEKLTKRQTEILGCIIDEYTKTAQPVGSKELVANYFNDLSSATIRQEMSYLEKVGYLKKNHTSSGRVPTTKGYEFYEANIIKPELSNNIKDRLKKIFQDRTSSIDSVIDQSVELINNIFSLPSVISVSNENDLLKKIDLIQLSSLSAIIILVTSSGLINKMTIDLQNNQQLDDIITCVQVFNEKLIDTKLSEINNKLNSIKDEIRQKVHEYEFVIQEFISKIFDFKEVNTTNVKGVRYLTTQPEFRDINKLNEVLEILENNNIWKQISYDLNKTGKTLITFGKKIGVEDLAVASTSIETGNKSHKISIVGPTRMDYKQIKALLDFIKEEIENVYKGN